MKFILLLLFFCFSKILFSQDSTNYFLSKNSWCAVKGDLYSDTIRFVSEPDSAVTSLEIFNRQEYLNHSIYHFDTSKMELSSYAVLTIPDSVMVTGDCQWRLSNDKKTITISDVNAGDATYFIVMLDEKRMLLIRKK